MQSLRKIAKLRCREICEPQYREINVSRKFQVIRYYARNAKFATAVNFPLSSRIFLSRTCIRFLSVRDSFFFFISLMESTYDNDMDKSKTTKK